MAVAGISTLGMKVGYGAPGTDDALPSSVTELTRVNSIGGISLETEQIDASAIDDAVSRYVAGRQDSGGTFDITVNVTDDVITEWSTILGTRQYIEVYSPNLQKGWWILVQIPKHIPLPDVNQNELLTASISLVIEKYVGLDTKVAIS